MTGHRPKYLWKKDTDVWIALIYNEDPFRFYQGSAVKISVDPGHLKMCVLIRKCHSWMFLILWNGNSVSRTNMKRHSVQSRGTENGTTGRPRPRALALGSPRPHVTRPHHGRPREPRQRVQGQRGRPPRMPPCLRRPCHRMEPNTGPRTTLSTPARHNCNHRLAGTEISCTTPRSGAGAVLGGRLESTVWLRQGWAGQGKGGNPKGGKSYNFLAKCVGGKGSFKGGKASAKGVYAKGSSKGGKGPPGNE